MDAETAARAMVAQQLEPRGIRDRRVLEAMQRVPRHAFVPGVDIATAYDDRALPTQHGQTISQPYIVARMTELLSVEPGDMVLEVGAGSGYQAAVLAAMGANVVGIERDQALVERARQTLDQLELGPGAGSIEIIAGDGTCGCPERAPFDRILITAATPDLPTPLAEQLRDPGRAVLPIGDRAQQMLTVIDHRDKQWTRTEDTPCRFVPLLGAHGFDEPTA
jgi:protein-L-isoaspartate(D-aspartate) O-methyltransferase